MSNKVKPAKELNDIELGHRMRILGREVNRLANEMKTVEADSPRGKFLISQYKPTTRLYADSIRVAAERKIIRVH